MLTTDLVRARVVRGEVRPAYVDASDKALIELADTLIGLFKAHVGKPRGALEDSLAELIGEDTDFLLHRGLAKLLEDRSEFVTDCPVDPVEFRRRVFERAALHHPVSREPGNPVHPTTRTAVLTAVGAELGLTPEQSERALYADLSREQILKSFEPIAASALLHRYNLALAQTVLLRAASLELELAPGDPQQYRQLFRFIKFFRLLYSAKGTGTQGYTITLDGPASLFHSSAKYGLQMAEFLPAILLCDGWSLRAELLWGKERKRLIFSLAAGSGLRTYYQDRGVYVTDEEAHFVKRFAEVAKGWRLDKRPEIYDLDGRGVLVPDFVIVNERDGREALLEIVGYWRKGYLEARGALLAEHGPKNLILAISQRLRASEEKLESMPGAYVFFKDVIPVKEIVALCERVATIPAGRSLRTTDDGAHPSKCDVKCKTTATVEERACESPINAPPKRARNGSAEPSR
jgi:predicted nuclease of restriction endonuclease-like RecB superfamily